MRNILKLISVSLVSLFISFSFANASSGVFKISHDLGFGKDTNLDAITKGRLFQVVIMTQNRLVRKDLKGKTSAELATDWSANAEGTLFCQISGSGPDGSENFKIPSRLRPIIIAKKLMNIEKKPGN